MEIVEAKLGDFTGKTNMLTSMEVSDTKALKVEKENVPTVRVTIARLSKRSNLKFKTTTDGEGGMYVWRLA
jgi:hypothetical protein